MGQPDPTQAVLALAGRMLGGLSAAEFYDLYDAIQEGTDPRGLPGYTKARALFAGQPSEGPIDVPEVLLQAFEDEARRRAPWA